MQKIIGFKEWEIVCDALASGRQAILLRKGGIHEGRHGFSFAHPSFFLFPTRFHTQGDLAREGAATLLPEWQVGEPIRITHHAEALQAITLTNWEEVAALEPFHIYSDLTVRDRFDWESKGMSSSSIHLALVRVRQLASPWEFPYEARFGGCRSWIELPEPPPHCLLRATPVLDETRFAILADRLGMLSK